MPRRESREREMPRVLLRCDRAVLPAAQRFGRPSGAKP